MQTRIHQEIDCKIGEEDQTSAAYSWFEMLQSIFKSAIHHLPYVGFERTLFHYWWEKFAKNKEKYLKAKVAFLTVQRLKKTEKF